MEEESPKEPTREEKAPIDTICTGETVQKENVKHEKLSVMFDSKNELDTDPLSNDKLPGDSHTKVDALVEKKKWSKSPFLMKKSIRKCQIKMQNLVNPLYLETSPDLVLRWRAY